MPVLPSYANQSIDLQWVNRLKVVVKKMVQAAYSNRSIRQQQWKVVHNVHWRGREQAAVAAVVVV